MLEWDRRYSTALLHTHTQPTELVCASYHPSAAWCWSGAGATPPCWLLHTSTVVIKLIRPCIHPCSVVLEWDRRYTTVLGVAGKRLYELRLQVRICFELK